MIAGSRQAGGMAGAATRGSRRRWWLLGLAFLTLSALLVPLVMVGSSDDPSSPEDPIDGHWFDEAPGPGESAGNGSGRSLKEFFERCLEVTESLDVATVSFDDSPTMRLDDTSELTLAIAPPGREVDGLHPQGEVLVTCTIDARLVIGGDDASVTPIGWETRIYLPPEPVQWSWFVTPSKAGEVDANIEIRPVVVIEADGSADTTEYTTKSYDLDITVEQTLWDRLSALTTHVKVVLGLVTAVTALAVALGVRRWGPAIWGRVRTRRTPAKDSAQRDSGYL